MKKMITLYADEGKVLTNGTSYGTTISLAEGLNGDDFFEITEEEYKKRAEAQTELETDTI